MAAPSSLESGDMPELGDWSRLLTFSEPRPGDKAGLIDNGFYRRAGFSLIKKGDPPLSALPVMPLVKCTTMQALEEQARGQFSMAFSMTPELHKMLAGVDALLDNWLVQPAIAKALMTPSAAAQVVADHGALRMMRQSPLAAFNPDGSPALEKKLRFRVHGWKEFVDPITPFDVRQRADGEEYVRSINWRRRTAPLDFNHTKFSIFRGYAPDGSIRAQSTLDIPKDEWTEGGPRVENVGPKHFTGGLVRAAAFKVSHWSSVNKANFFVTLSLVSVVFENQESVALLPKGVIEWREEDESDAKDVKRARGGGGDDGSAPAFRRSFKGPGRAMLD